MIYAAIDTNVLVSALLHFNSNPGTVLLSVLNGETIPLVNDEILAEYREVLSRKKLKISAELAESVLTRFAACCLNIADASSEYPEVTDPKDRCFYAVTMSERETEDVLLSFKYDVRCRFFVNSCYQVVEVSILSLLRVFIRN